MNLRLHLCRVAPAEDYEKCDPNRPTRRGSSCNNAPLEALVGFSRWGFRLLGDLFFSYQSSILIPGSWTTTWSVQILVLPELRIVDHRSIPRAIL